MFEKGNSKANYNFFFLFFLLVLNKTIHGTIHYNIGSMTDCLSFLIFPLSLQNKIKFINKNKHILRERFFLASLQIRANTSKKKKEKKRKRSL